VKNKTAPRGLSFVKRISASVTTETIQQKQSTGIKIHGTLPHIYWGHGLAPSMISSPIS
jgi:hypothetical protein